MVVNLKKIFNKYTLALACIVCASAWLRIHRLTMDGLWLDECISIRVARLNFFRIILQRYGSFHPPLYYLSLHYWMQLFGASEFSVRMLSLIFGVLSVYLIYRVAKLYFDKETGLLSAFLLAISIFHIEYSREARMYTMAVFFSILAFYLFGRIASKFKKKTAVYYVITISILIYTHVTSLLIVLAHNVYVFAALTLKQFTGKIDLKRWGIIMLAGVLTLVPLLRYSLLRLKVVQGIKHWIARPTPNSIIDTFSTYAGSPLLMLVCVALAIFAIVKYARALREDSAEGHGIGYPLTLLWLFTPIAVPIVMSVFSASLYATKYTIVGSPAFYILVARGLSLISRRPLKIVLIGLICLFSSVKVLEYYSTFHKPQWKHVSQYITANAKEGDLLVFNDKESKKIIFDYYYFKRRDVIEMVSQGRSPAPYILATDENIRLMRKTVEGYPRVWVIISHSRDRNNLVSKYFEGDYKMLYHNVYHSIEVFLLEKKGEGAPEKGSA